MESLSEIIRAGRPVEGGSLRVAASESRPFVAVDPQNLRVEVAAGASAAVVVVHETPGASALDVSLERDARLQLTEIFLAGAFAEVSVGQAAGSRCCATVVQLAGANAVYRVGLNGPYAENSFNGLFLVADQEHGVLDLRTEHRVPDCSSDSSIRGIAGGSAVGEFRGLVYVAPDAQRTDARQQSRNILLSDGARIVAEPQLEIYADDVKCSHGATVGQMDAEAILYMRQRGLSLAQARRLQIEGFAGDVVRRCGIGELGEALMAEVARKMERM